MRALVHTLTATLSTAIGCAAVPPPAPPAVDPEVIVDFSGVFGGRASSSIFDPRVIGPGTMHRVLLEPTTLAADGRDEGMESWTRRKLVQRLGRAGTFVLGPPPPTCPRAAECYAARPTAALRNLRLPAGRDGVKVRVHRDEHGGFVVALHRDLGTPSLCPAGFELRLGFVQLLGQVQTLPAGVVAGVFHELALLDAPEESRLQVRLPDPATDPTEFCAGLRDAFERTPGFAVDDARYERAAEAVLKVGLHPLYPRPEASGG